ncbi:MAG TPA: ATP synthase subunit I [Methylomirabilota bacterium]|nr:ATP synthase subunit I [Methylomirabilota bacterium]
MRELRARVTLVSAATAAVLAGLAYGLAGPAAGLGVAAAGGLTLANFWWLVHNAAVVTDIGPASRRLVWAVASGVRLLALVAALALLLASGLVHAVAFVVGLVIVPGAVIVLGLRAACRVGAG